METARQAQPKAKAGGKKKGNAQPQPEPPKEDTEPGTGGLPVEDPLSILSVPDLRAVLQKRGLKVGGDRKHSDVISCSSIQTSPA